MKYIDVSEWQGVINWEQVKGHVDGVIIRAGRGSKGTPDARFTYNASECNRLGIPCGAYWFSYAKSAEEARAAAEHLLAAVTPYKMELPLCYDFEYDSVDNAEAQGVKVDKEFATALVVTFCSTIEYGGYWALNYTNQDFLKRLYDEKLLSVYGLWLAAWKLSASPDLSKSPRTCDIWQWGLSSVPGITGKVDTSESYKDFPKLIREAGLNHLTQTTEPDALKWAKSFHITEDPALAEALYRYHAAFHAPEEYKSSSGLLSD